MLARSVRDLTAILDDVHAGRDDARERLVSATYQQLRRIAAGLMRRERPVHTLQPTALVHEAVIRIFYGAIPPEIPNRRYLFGAAAGAMRRILVEHERRRRTAKRDAARVRVRLPIDKVLLGFEEQGLDVIALHEALDRLTQAHPRPAEVVTLRFFGGLSVPEVAEVLGISDTTVEGDWRFARAWLRGALGEGAP
jgi:RNA polymerase sigma factor (TIGR02999 family)